MGKFMDFLENDLDDELDEEDIDDENVADMSATGDEMVMKPLKPYKIQTIAPDATPKETVVMKIANAIQVHEGWFIGSRSYITNNPGNLRYIGQKGSTGKDKHGMAIFPDYNTGYVALLNDILSKIKAGRNTIREIITRYAPPSENDTIAYINAVVQSTGIGADTPLV